MRQNAVRNIDSEVVGRIACASLRHEDEVPRTVVSRSRVCGTRQGDKKAYCHCESESLFIIISPKHRQSSALPSGNASVKWSPTRTISKVERRSDYGKFGAGYLSRFALIVLDCCADKDHSPNDAAQSLDCKRPVALASRGNPSLDGLPAQSYGGMSAFTGRVN